MESGLLPAVRPFLPPVISPADARTLCLWHRRRPPLAMLPELRLRAALPPPAPGLAAVSLLLAGNPATLLAPPALLRALQATAQPGLDADLAPPLRDLVLELALEPAITALEALLGGPVQLGGPGAVPNATMLGMEVLSRDAAYRVALLVPPAAAAFLARLCDRLPTAPAPVPLPAVLSLRVAATALPLAALRRLRAGDVILPATRGGDAMVVAGEALCWPVRLQGRQATVSAPRRSALSECEWTMPDRPALPDAGPDDARIEDLPVRLAFELGRLEVPYGELAAIGPGHVFALPRDPAAGQVDILCNGRRAGQGEIVRIGETLGIRVLRLFGCH